VHPGHRSGQLLCPVTGDERYERTWANLPEPVFNEIRWLPRLSPGAMPTVGLGPALLVDLAEWEILDRDLGIFVIVALRVTDAGGEWVFNRYDIAR
jgi:hypothetical protein